MIVCRDCGHQNEDDAQFCGSCRSFLEFSGDRIVEVPPTTEPEEEDDPTPAGRVIPVVKGVVHRIGDAAADLVRSPKGTDEPSAEELAAETQRAATEAAERESAAKADAAARAAAERLAVEERARAEALERAAAAEAQLEEMQRRHAEDTRRREEAAAATQRESARHREAELALAERQARADAEQARLDAEERIAAAEQEAQAQRVAAAAASAQAQAREAAARDATAAAQKRLEEAAAQAAAATLRASQEADALAAAEAARHASELQAEQARAEANAAAAAAAEEVARARAEAEAARAEAAELRAKAEALTARNAREKEAAEFEERAEAQAARARREAEERLEAEHLRARAEADARATRDAAAAEAAERKAEAELVARQAEAKAAAARAEEERARTAAEVEAARRDREEALRRAAALVAPAVTASAATTPPSAPAATKPAPKAPAPTAPVKDTAALGDAIPAAQKPGEVQRQSAPKRTVARDAKAGDLICGTCGAANDPTRSYCRKCASSLSEAKPLKMGFFARWKAKRRAKKAMPAGSRRGRAAAKGAQNIGTKGRLGWWKVNATLMRVGAVLGVLAVFGFGVEPIRQKLHLPNVRQKVIDTIRRNATPVYDPVRPASASATSSASGTTPAALIDLANNTTWMAAPTASGGVGARVLVTFLKPVDIARILMTSGASGTEEGAGFVSQPRPSELRVVFDGDTANPVTVPVKDKAEPQVLKISRKQVGRISIEVTGVYPAANGKGKSVAITELEFFEKRKFGDDYETLPAPAVRTSSASADAKALTDDDLATAWTSDSTADGVGQGFTLTFATPTDVARIRLAPGHAESEFQISPRPKEVQIAITCEGRCDPTKQISLKDKPGWQAFTLKATGVTKLEVTVRSVHGTGGGVALAELQVQRKRPKVN